MAVKGKKSNCVVSLAKVQELSKALNQTSQQLFGLDPQMLQRLVTALENPAAVNKMLQKSAWAKAENVLYETAVNFMVAGFDTQKVNTIGNASVIGWQFLKSGLQVASAVGTLNPRQVRSESIALARQFEDVVRTTKDMWFAAFPNSAKYVPVSVAGRLGVPGQKPYSERGWKNLNDLPLDLFSHPDFVVGTKQKKQLFQVPQSPTRQKAASAAADNDRERAIASSYFGLNPNSFAGKGVDITGAIINISGEMLRHEDLMAKAINYRMAMTRLARARADKLGKNIADSDAIFETLLKFPSEDMIIEAANVANRNTFTEELGSFASSARAFLQKPVLRFATPFFRTLVNLQKLGLRESAIGEIGKALHLYKGENYWKTLASRTAEGDAARAKLASSTLLTYGIVSMFDKDPLVDGYGFTGHLDMRDESQRLRAETIAPAFSYKFADGEIWNFQDIEPLRTILAFYMGGKELLQMSDDGVPKYDTETGQEIDLQQQVFDIIVTPLEHLYGDYFAMESFQKITTAFEAMIRDGEGDRDKARQILSDVAVTLFGGPAYLRDIKSTGSIIEDWMGVEQSRKIFDNEMRMANSLLEKLDNKWFGSEHGVPYTLWGDRKKARAGLTLAAQSSLFTAERQPDELDFELAKLKVPFLDNPREVNIPGQNARVRLTTQQREEFMRLGGQGGKLKEIDVEIPSMRDFLRNIAFNPEIAKRPEHIRQQLLATAIRDRQNAIAGYLALKHSDLREQVENQKVAKAQLDTGQLSPNVPLDWKYVRDLFNFPQLQQLLN